MQPSLERMDLHRLRKDIPKWFKWITEDAAEEWESFLLVPLEDSIRECALPFIQRLSHCTMPVNETPQVEHPSTVMRSAVSYCSYTRFSLGLSSLHYQ